MPSLAFVIVTGSPVVSVARLLIARRALMPGGVDEADAAEVEHDGMRKRAEAIDRALQLGCRVQVDLAAHLDDEALSST